MALIRLWIQTDVVSYFGPSIYVTLGKLLNLISKKKTKRNLWWLVISEESLLVALEFTVSPGASRAWTQRLHFTVALDAFPGPGPRAPPAAPPLPRAPREDASRLWPAASPPKVPTDNQRVIMTLGRGEPSFFTSTDYRKINVLIGHKKEKRKKSIQ